MKYVKRPVIIDAWKWPEEGNELPGDCNGGFIGNRFFIKTPDGDMEISDGHYILKDNRGFYPCQPDIFETTYDKV